MIKNLESIKSKKRIGIKEIFYRLEPHLFYIPSLIIFSIVLIYPLVGQIFLGFFDWRGLGGIKFAGLNNYIRMFTSSGFKESLLNNFIYFVFIFVFLNIISISVAIILSEKSRNKLLINRFNVFFRVCFFLPVVLSPVVTSLIFGFLFKNNGFLNNVLAKLGLNFLQQSWLVDERFVLYIIGIITVWQYFGYYILMYYAGLMLIPQEVIEAAEIDGVSLFQKIRYIILPLLKQSFIIVTILTFMDAFQIFEIPLILTRGGPNYASSVVSLLIVQHTIKFNNFGYAASMTTLISVFIITATIIYLRNIMFKKESV